MTRIAAVVLVVVCLLLVGTAMVRDLAVPTEPVDPPSDEALWRSLPPELLADVIEGKREQISDIQDDIDLIQAIRESKMSGARPPA